MSIYSKLGVTPIINACGTVTRLGGAHLSPNVLSAYADASVASVTMDSIQAAASRRISAETGAEAALVTGGAAAGLMLGAAAFMAKFDLAAIDRLPDTSGLANQLIIARSHRCGYDHAVRTAGAELVEVGLDEIHSGAGVRFPEVWEYVSAINESTAGILYRLTEDSQPALDEVIKAAHEHNLPVLVDAAAQLPPKSNLRAIGELGADLVVFSGGKSIGGPQATGILCGRREFVGSAFLQMMDNDDHFEMWDPPSEFIDKSKLHGIPRHGIGRVAKVAKEEIVAFLTALEEFTSTDEQATFETHMSYLGRIRDALKGLSVTTDIHESAVPVLNIGLNPNRSNDAMDICKHLRSGDPPIYVGHGRLLENVLQINPFCLRESEVDVVADRIRIRIEDSK